MAESLYIAPAESVKSERYAVLLPQLESLLVAESDLTANLANVAAALKQTFGFFWIGFYLVRAEELVLGPFQGPLACTRIAYGKGVCGTAWKEGRTLLVPDVEQFPGHIACSSDSKSEIVVPVFANDRVVAVIDADSTLIADFDEHDAAGLQKVASLVSRMFTQSGRP
jgi:GAF domain-containing protein